MTVITCGVGGCGFSDVGAVNLGQQRRRRRGVGSRMGRVLWHSRRLVAVLALGAVLPWLVGGGWVDPDSEDSVKTTRALVDGRTFQLVFSDEFEVEGRNFGDGQDPRWTAIHKNDYTNTALQFYDKNLVTTAKGLLNITTVPEDTEFLAFQDDMNRYRKAKKHFKSAMVQGWNKFCFTGGILEVRALLPGEAYVGGLWPAIWLMGNLARATYVGSSNWMWPWSFDKCSRSLQKQQLVSACDPHPHYGMEGHRGRGAPEIDILEAMPGKAPLPKSKVGKPYFSTSLQIAPGIEIDRPQNGVWPGPGMWYEGMEYGDNSTMNIFFYGTRNVKKNDDYTYQSDALSGNTQLDHTLWKQWHTFRLEWETAESDPLREGYIRWYMDDQLIYGISGQTLSQHMNSQVPSEPVYLILNTAMSSTWGFPQPCPEGCSCQCFDCNSNDHECTCGISDGFCKSLPASFFIDYVRVYQSENSSVHKVGCSTPERPTSKWIEGHQDLYKDDWDDQPLKPVKCGGGSCSANNECGSAHGGGQCQAGKCKCNSQWTGSHCMAHSGFDDQVWERERELGFALPSFPLVLQALFIAIVVGFAISTIVHVLQMRHARVLGVQFTTPHGAFGSSKQTSRWTRRETALMTDATPLLHESNRKFYSRVPLGSEVQLSRMIADEE